MILDFIAAIRSTLLDRRGILALFSGILIALSFPTPGLAFLAWIALIPLLIAFEDTSYRTAFRVGFICGIGAYAGILYWLNVVLTRYGELPWIVSLSVYLLLVFWLALFFGLAVMTARIGENQEIKSAFTLPIAWVAFDLLRSFLFSGFPWAMLGYSQYRILPLIQIADVIGVYGITAVIVLANVVLYRVLRALSGAGVPYPVKSAVILLLFMILLLGYGFKRLNIQAENPDAPIQVALIQGNIPQDIKWSASFRDQTINIYERLSREAAKVGGIDLIVWPESAVPFFFQDEPRQAERLRELARNLETTLLFGSPAYELRNGLPTLMNSAFVVAPTGKTIGRSDKLHLVPFGEYVPFGSFFPFITKIVEGIGDFAPGKHAVPLNIGKTVAGTLVCYEIIFPEIAREYVNNGARLLINITNDAWFGKTSAPYQHMAIAVFRAVETRTPLIRAANTGITAIVDQNGHIGTMTELFVEGYRTGSVSPGTADSLYLKIGDAPAWLCIFLTVLIFIRAGIRKKQKPL